ncbi:monocarboxylate transporter 12-B-like [Diadema setosum]|uniref:monocarboxylate transporter 12-B-like n=1 Tax=Diadema setosum TaxID=31175 RepID=UPI003B3B02E3
MESPGRPGFRWLILAGIASINFLELGILKSYEVFYEDFRIQIQLSPATAGLAMSSSQGLAYAFGVGYSCVYAPTMAALFVYFPDMFDIASGLVYTSAGVGIMVLPIVAEYLGKIYGWRGTLLILGGLSLFSVVCGALLRPNGSFDKTEDSSKQKRHNDSHKMMTHAYASSRSGDPGKSSSQDSDQGNGIGNCGHALRSAWFEFLKLLSTILGVELHMSYPLFITLDITLFLYGIGYATSMTFIISNAVSKGLTLENAVPSATALGVGNIAGRFVAGFFSKRQLLPNSVTTCALFTCSATVFFLNQVVYTYFWLVVLAAASGFLHGCALLQRHSFEFAFTVIGLLELLAGVTVVHRYK